jgi:hypothetical protein
VAYTAMTSVKDIMDKTEKKSKPIKYAKCDHSVNFKHLTKKAFDKFMEKDGSPVFCFDTSKINFKGTQ